MHIDPKTLDEMIDRFIRDTENLSEFGDTIWDRLFEDIEVCHPEMTDWGYHDFNPNWIKRNKLPKLRLNVQGSFLVTSNTYSSEDLGRELATVYSGDYCQHFNDGMKTTSQMMNACRGDKHKIATVFLYAYLTGEESWCLEFENFSYKFRYLKEKSPHFRWILCDQLHPRISGWGVSWFIHQHRRVLPDYINNIPFWERRKFEDDDDFIRYLAMSFAMMISHYCIFNFKPVAELDQTLMDELDKVVVANRAATAKQQRKREELHRKREELHRKNLEEKEARDEAFAKDYPLHCQEILRYTDEIPQLFKRHKSLHNEWDGLSQDDLEMLVWSAPMSTLAKMLDVSDRAIAKKCDRLGVFRPVGLWRKIETGAAEYPKGVPNFTYVKR